MNASPPNPSKRRAVWLPLAALLGLSACTVMPTGPSVMALPGTGKSFDAFRTDDYNCRQYALGQVGGLSASQGATAAGVGSAAVGTAVGAAAGAAFGGGRGAAVGAGAGLLTGSAIGMGTAQGSAYDIQRRYDFAYLQCMYAAGERVPMPAGMIDNRPPRYLTPPPPPPPGYRY